MRIILGAGPVRGVRRDEVSGLYPKRGTIEIGADADIVIWDPKREKTLGVKTLHMNVDYSPFEGKVVTVSPLVLSVKGVNTTITVASPALIARNDAPSTLADVKVGDRASVTAIRDATTVTAFLLAFYPGG